MRFCVATAAAVFVIIMSFELIFFLSLYDVSEGISALGTLISMSFITVYDVTGIIWNESFQPLLLLVPLVLYCIYLFLMEEKSMLSLTV